MAAARKLTDEQWMERAIAVAMAGRGSVEPNPMVGCVLVRDGRVVGQGLHEYFGGPHAEPNALSAARELAKGATAYVTLEPCCHKNKKTPPCVPALISAGIARVVVACLDPNPLVRGNGVKELKRAGVEVSLGVLEKEAKQLNAAYFAGVLYERPYVTLKWAQSADGKVAGPQGQRRTISGRASLKVMHELRSRCDAIMVSLRTVLFDDPLLLPRGVAKNRVPIRVVLDPELRFEPRFQLAKTINQGPVLLYCGRRAFQTRSAGIVGLMARKVAVVPVTSRAGHLSMSEIYTDLHLRGVSHLMVEPGPRLAAAMLSENLADRVWIFRSPKTIPHESAPAAAEVLYTPVAAAKLGADYLSEYLNPSSEVFYAGRGSADMVAAVGD